MMREIKFRGKRVDNGEWVYGYYLKSASTFFAVDDGLVDGHFDLYKVDPETVGQYTGLKDIDGKEIYEGDIVQHNDLIGIVYWDDEYGVFAESCHDDMLGNHHRVLEVIGNIWDNPELLGGEANA